MSINLSALMKQRYDTAANWTAQNPTLLAGEFGIESDTKKWKVGDGSTAWTSLLYSNGGTYPIVNADIAAGAAIDDTKLATIETAGKVSNSATTAASANTASAIVARDASGNFTASTITAALTGAASSNVLKAGDTMTGALVVPAGTVTANGIQVGTGTTYKPGIYSPGTNQVAISTNGTGRLFVDANGNLLAGIASASALAAGGRGLFELNGSSDAVCSYRSGGTLVGYSLGSSSEIRLASFTAIPVTFYTDATERARIDSSGRLLVGGSPDSGGALLQVFGNRIRIGTAKTPASASDTGTAGEICWDASYIYVCTATNTWKRTAIATW